MLSRRKFLQSLGIGVAGALLYTHTDAAFAEETAFEYTASDTGTAPLAEGVPPEPIRVTASTTKMDRWYRGFDTKQLEALGASNIKYMNVVPTKPYKDDPLAQFGFVSVKYTWLDDKQYGDWVKYTDYVYDCAPDHTIGMANEVLLESQVRKLQLLNRYKVLSDFRY